MNSRMRFIGALAALILPASVAAGSALTTATASPAGDDTAARSATSVSIKVLPQIAQPGAGAASSDAAKAIARVAVSPRRTGVAVTVQAKSGTTWVNVTSAKTDKRGVVEAQVAPTRDGLPAVYRAVAQGVASAEADLAKWGTPVFSDDFNGALSSAWTHRAQTYQPKSLRVCSKGSPKAAKTGGGTLKLSVLKDKSRKPTCKALRNGKKRGPFAYRLNGHVSTENSFSFTYGVAAARIKFQPKEGQHASFWMQPHSAVSGGFGPTYTGAEIDVIEWFGAGKDSGGLTQFTYHNASWTKRVKTGGHIPNVDRFLTSKKDSWFKRYHVFSVEWTPSEYIFYIDGQESWRSNKGISHRPQFLILSLLSSDYEIAKAGDRGLGSQSTSIDWIRVWQPQA
mgnify:CR=1 FL=1